MSLLTKEQFGTDFSWGVSTSAYQIEGAYDQDGKGMSIWDDFVLKKKRILKNQNGNLACDFYHRYAHDLALMRSLNITNHRFSISWSRILPNGTGAVNPLGLDFYDRLVDFSLELGIVPWVTLYHWDLPLALEKRGGWTNRDVREWFADYVTACLKRLGDRVRHWMVLNEPAVFCAAGYFFGIHAPGRRGLDNFLAATHHAALTQAHGARIIRSLQNDSIIGTTFSCSHLEPFSLKEKDLIALSKADVLLNRLYVEPLLGMGYPTAEIKALGRIERYMRPEDESNLKFDMDFIGVQNYTREFIRHSFFVPYMQAEIVSAQKRGVETTDMNWEVYPPSIYHMLKKFAAYPNIPTLVVTESGAAFPDHLQGGTVEDPKRVKYLHDTIEQVFRAKQEKVNVSGYFVWTFLDNFEWAEGYRPRFGLVYVDHATQKRVVKSSGRWYADFLR